MEGGRKRGREGGMENGERMKNEGERKKRGRQES